MKLQVVQAAVRTLGTLLGTASRRFHMLPEVGPRLIDNECWTHMLPAVALHRKGLASIVMTWAVKTVNTPIQEVMWLSLPSRATTWGAPQGNGLGNIIPL